MEDRAHEYDGSHKAATHKDILFATLCMVKDRFGVGWMKSWSCCPHRNEPGIQDRIRRHCEPTEI
jgi:hypothetical protein